MLRKLLHTMLRFCFLPSLSFILLLLPIYTGCNGSRNSAKSEARPVVDLPAVDPGQVRVVGTLVGVDSTLSSRPNDPCGLAPCLGMVRIDSVLEYGSSFPAPLSEGSAIPVRFAFTLAPTEGMIEDLNAHYPGLQIGDRFVANIRARAAMSAARSTPPAGATYTVYEYYVNG